MMTSNDTAVAGEHEGLEVIRQPLHLLVAYCLAYGLVWIVGLIGNAFVVLSVALNSSMRSITNYFIFNLALADLLISQSVLIFVPIRSDVMQCHISVVFCLPATLMNNILTGK